MEVPRHRGSVHLAYPAVIGRRERKDRSMVPTQPRRCPFRHPPGGRDGDTPEPTLGHGTPESSGGKGRNPFHRRIIQPCGGVVAVKWGRSCATPRTAGTL